MTFAEQLGLDRIGICWCCGGLGIAVDDWDAVEPCMFCHGPRTQPAISQPMTDAGCAIETRSNSAEDQPPG